MVLNSQLSHSSRTAGSKHGRPVLELPEEAPWDGQSMSHPDGGQTDLPVLLAPEEVRTSGLVASPAPLDLGPIRILSA